MENDSDFGSFEPSNEIGFSEGNSLFDKPVCGSPSDFSMYRRPQMAPAESSSPMVQSFGMGLASNTPQGSFAGGGRTRNLFSFQKSMGDTPPNVRQSRGMVQRPTMAIPAERFSSPSSPGESSQLKVNPSSDASKPIPIRGANAMDAPPGAATSQFPRDRNSFVVPGTPGMFSASMQSFMAGSPGFDGAIDASLTAGLNAGNMSMMPNSSYAMMRTDSAEGEAESFRPGVDLFRARQSLRVGGEGSPFYSRMPSSAFSMGQTPFETDKDSGFLASSEYTGPSMNLSEKPIPKPLPGLRGPAKPLSYSDPRSDSLDLSSSVKRRRNVAEMLADPDAPFFMQP